VITLKTYFIVFGTLLALTGVTTGAAFINLGPFNAAVAMSIASTKALLVGLYFMHLRHSNRLTIIFALASLLWLAHMLIASLSDYITRPW
jgi:cytochrome c oxidase subunit IV